MKTAKPYLGAAHKLVERIDAAEAIRRHGQDNFVIVDVREGATPVVRWRLDIVTDPGLVADRS